MSLADARRDSPCIDVCRIDPATGWCVGCRRSLDEIVAWGGLDAGARRRILDQLPGRVVAAATPATPASAATPTGHSPAAPSASGRRP